MADEVAGRDGVMIDEAVHEIYKHLTEGNDPASVPFRTMKDVFMWAVCLGYQRGDRRPIVGKKTLIFRWAQFSPQTDVPLLKAIAIAGVGDINILSNREEILSIAEEYANAGIYELRAQMLDDYGQPLWRLVSQVTEDIRRV